MVSSFFPRKLSHLMLNTMASSKIRSREHSNASSSLKLLLHSDGFLLLVNTIMKWLSLLYLRSITSKNRRVFSLSNPQCRTSSIIKQEAYKAIEYKSFLTRPSGRSKFVPELCYLNEVSFNAPATAFISKDLCQMRFAGSGRALSFP